MNPVQQALDRIASREVDSNLPLVSSSDNGKILKVAGGVWSKAAAELPAVTADDNGDVLMVSDGAWSKQAVTPELPAVTADDNGKVLMVVEGAWAVASLPD